MTYVALRKPTTSIKTTKEYLQACYRQYKPSRQRKSFLTISFRSAASQGNNISRPSVGNISPLELLQTRKVFLRNCKLQKSHMSTGNNRRRLSLLEKIKAPMTSVQACHGQYKSSRAFVGKESLFYKLQKRRKSIRNIGIHFGLLQRYEEGLYDFLRPQMTSNFAADDERTALDLLQTI